MKTVFASVFVLLCLLVIHPVPAHAWGTWGHNHINKGAIMALPPEMGMFFYNHADFIIEESTVPDLRKYTMNDKSERPRHYINLEKYGYHNEPLPRTLEQAKTKYSEDSVALYGILPWHMQEMMIKLTNAFKNKRKTEILFLAADLGHYIGDAHMPLHTTHNHDGQLTGQQGIHALWEAQLPEMFGKKYNLNAGEAHYIKNIEAATWEIMDSSYALLTRLLVTDHRMRSDKPNDRKYLLDKDGKPIKNKFGQDVHSYEYAHVYHELLEGMVEQQMRLAIQFTASFWYTAWVNAGKPDLGALDNEAIAEKNKPSYTADLASWKKGKVRGCNTDKEFPPVTPER